MPSAANVTSGTQMGSTVDSITSAQLACHFRPLVTGQGREEKAIETVEALALDELGFVDLDSHVRGRPHV